MATPDDFRRIALGMNDTIASAHMGHPDFRINGRIFSTLHADREWGTVGMVILTPDQQARFIEEHPASFQPENGAWGRVGCTRVRLDTVDDETLGEALTLAWQNISSKGPAKRSKRKPASRTTRPARKHR